MKESTKRKQWIRPRHRIITAIAKVVLRPVCQIKYGLQAEPFKEQGGRAYLILYNHQTPFDQFFVAMSFRGAVYYMATEDIFSLGWVSSLLRWLVAPIPIRKQTTDISAVKTCIRVAREGGSLAIAPEGNRTYSGKTEYMNPAIAGLARKTGLPIALYRIEGGYGVEPRWSDKVRRGKIRAYVSQIIEPEDYKSLTNEQLMARIEEGLYVNEGVADGCYTSDKRAEYLERAIYVCPYCGLSVFESHGNEVGCKTCGRKILYGEDKGLTGAGFDFPFGFVTQWYDYQADFINRLDVLAYCAEPMYRDTARLSEVEVFRRKHLVRKEVRVALYGDRIVIDEGAETEQLFPFGETGAVTVLGRNKLNIYFGKQVFQLKGGKRFNALKYVHIYNRYKNISRGDTDGKFLGL